MYPSEYTNFQSRMKDPTLEWRARKQKSSGAVAANATLDLALQASSESAAERVTEPASEGSLSSLRKTEPTSEGSLASLRITEPPEPAWVTSQSSLASMTQPALGHCASSIATLDLMLQSSSERASSNPSPAKGAWYARGSLETMETLDLAMNPSFGSTSSRSGRSSRQSERLSAASAFGRLLRAGGSSLATLDLVLQPSVDSQGGLTPEGLRGPHVWAGAGGRAAELHRGGSSLATLDLLMQSSAESSQHLDSPAPAAAGAGFGRGPSSPGSLDQLLRSESSVESRELNRYAPHASVRHGASTTRHVTRAATALLARASQPARGSCRLAACSSPPALSGRVDRARGAIA